MIKPRAPESPVNVFARIEGGLAKGLHQFAAREGKLLRTVVGEALEAFHARAEVESVSRAAIRAYTRALARGGRPTGIALQMESAQKEKISRLARRLKVKKQVLYGAAIMAYLPKTGRKVGPPKKREA